jgi:hypothetical protein
MYQNNKLHSFYIPVMGTGFTIDTPLFVAKYGISSVVSLVDDYLVEQLRKLWCEKTNESYEPINREDKDARAKRITAYLNLMQKIVEQQLADVKASAFEPNSEITKYFIMLPDGKLKQTYENMLAEKDATKKKYLQEELRQAVVAGSIDVNIMTKLDGKNYHKGEELPYEFCDAAAALRGYANSNLVSTLVLSAGFNPQLYGYMAKFVDFFPDANGVIKKKICLKVSDYRSAAIQGKYLAKHGLWVSEYRIESALNCGGHAFINDGQLMGPILAEFKQRKDELLQTLHEFYQNALTKIKNFCINIPQKVKITAQGGVGTKAEHDLLLQKYGVDAVGWGTPFLLVPEAVNIDDESLARLISAEDDDVFLSSSSPLGVPFWNLKNSLSEEMRRSKIASGNPGSFCVKGYLKFNQEFTNKPVCQASREYQKIKLQELAENENNCEKIAELKNNVLSKSCICHELCGSVLIKNNIATNISPAICPGPNILNFKKISSLKEMVDHIYGRCSLIINAERPHMFIREIQLQVDYLFDEMRKASFGLPVRSKQKLLEVKENLKSGIEHYRKFAKEILDEQRDNFMQALQELQQKIDGIVLDVS